MCVAGERPTKTATTDVAPTPSQAAAPATTTTTTTSKSDQAALKEASLLARYTCASILIAILSVWYKVTFVSPESSQPGINGNPMHSFLIPLFLTSFYLISLPILQAFTRKFLVGRVNVKSLLKESMVIYNGVQVLLNGWMVFRFLKALWMGHPFINDIHTWEYGTSFATWVHYCDKYLEFFDTYFMILRGRMDQVSFLHIYHHTTIAWAWWIAVSLIPSGDSYFGALFNSWIHVMMYSYYTLSLLKVACPWKKYLTLAQLIQFASVVVYTVTCTIIWEKGMANKGHYFAVCVQLWEMTSLFVLFSFFYRKSYGKKKTQDKNKVKAGDKNKTADSPKEDSTNSTAVVVAEVKKENDDSDDQCEAAVKALFTNTPSQMIESAAKDANKIVTSAKKTLIESTGAVQKEVGDAMSRPSWSMVE